MKIVSMSAELKYPKKRLDLEEMQGAVLHLEVQ